MLVDAWLKVVGAFTPEDMKFLKARGCASESFEFLDAFDKFTLAWRRREPGLVNTRDWTDIQNRLQELRAALGCSDRGNDGVDNANAREDSTSY